MPGSRLSRGSDQGSVRRPDDWAAGAPARATAEATTEAVTEATTEAVADGLAWSRVPRAWRRAIVVTLAIVLTLGFLAYQSPEMRINWETAAALCGF